MIITGNPADVAGAYVKARSEMETLVAKEGKGVYGKYMELATILEMVTPILARHGLVCMQEPMTTEEGVGVATTILHSSGARIEFVPLVIALTKREPHASGSALSYAKRYALAAVFGLAGDDDDGQTAQDTYKPKATKAAPAQNSYHDDELWEPSSNTPKKPDTLSQAQLTRLHILGQDLYGSEWDEQRVKLVQAASKGAVTSSKELSADEATVLIKGMEKKLKEVQALKAANGKVHA